jgi:4-hydroxybenzoate polyprenyltransferase
MDRTPAGTLVSPGPPTVVTSGARGRLRLRELGRFLEIQNLGLNLPFGIAFLLAAARGVPPWPTVLLIVVALVAARNAGHAFNRWADRDVDARNPRTADRALVTGRLSSGFALAFAALNGALLVIAAGLLNRLALSLSPLALALVFGYSYTKRYTSLTTVFLGLVEAAVPAAVFIAVQGALPLPAIVAVLAILSWGVAFETVHSLGDLAADRSLGLRSLPLRLGSSTALRLVPALHAAALLLLALFGALLHYGLAYWGAWALMVGITAATDLRLARYPRDTRIPFRRHFLVAFVFLLGVGLALALPGMQI